MDQLGWISSEMKQVSFVRNDDSLEYGVAAYSAKTRAQMENCRKFPQRSEVEKVGHAPQTIKLVWFPNA